jgi:hypothetical protein
MRKNDNILDGPLKLLGYFVGTVIFVGMLVSAFSRMGWHITVPFTDYYEERQFYPAHRIDPDNRIQEERQYWAMSLKRRFELDKEARVGLNGTFHDVVLIEQPDMDFTIASEYANKGILREAKLLNCKALVFSDRSGRWLGPYTEYILREDK